MDVVELHNLYIMFNSSIDFALFVYQHIRSTSNSQNVIDVSWTFKKRLVDFIICLLRVYHMKLKIVEKHEIHVGAWLSGVPVMFKKIRNGGDIMSRIIYSLVWKGWPSSLIYFIFLSEVFHRIILYDISKKILNLKDVDDLMSIGWLLII